LDTTDGFKKANEITIILPSPVFPVPMPEIESDVNLEPPDDGGHAEGVNQAIEKVNALKEAKDEILAALRMQDLVEMENYHISQQQTLKEGNSITDKCGTFPTHPDPPFSEYLRIENYNNLSENAKDMIEEVGLSDNLITRDNVTESFARNISETYDVVISLASTPGSLSTSVVIGASVVTLSNYCIDLFNNSNPCNPFFGGTIPVGSGGINPIGVGDLINMDQRLLKYEMGELAHIENIMASEDREREHRKFKRVEETFTTETEHYSETETHSQTTERFSMERETSNVISNMQQNQSSQDSGFGVGVTASYGPVSVNASYNSSTSNSSSSVNASSNAASSATRFAKEVSQKALKRVIEKVREQRSRTTIDEIEEINKGSFLNGSGSSHIVGMYHWIDKFYKVRLNKYGLRTFFEFMIPEPAAFHIYSKLNSPVEGEKFSKPEPPSTLGVHTFRNIDGYNYARLAAHYGVTDMPSPPEQYIWINKAIARDQVVSTDPWPADKNIANDDLEIPDGYVADWFELEMMNSWHGNVQAMVGRFWRSSGGNLWGGPLDPMNRKVPVILLYPAEGSFGCNIMIKVKLSIEAWEKWQMKAYNALMDTYNRKLADYDDRVAGARVSGGVQIQGENPEINRAVEKEELKRAALELLTGQKFEVFDAMQDNQPSQKYPQFINSEAKSDGNYVKFFETAFEWHNLIYHFYPYFWSRKKKWVVLKNHQDTDPLFTKFLQAGYARVLVPVRPEMLGDILYYCKTGQLWSGGNPPAFTDPNYISLLTEIQNSQGITDENPDMIKEWEYKVPTSLVMLQGSTSPTLPDFSV